MIINDFRMRQNNGFNRYMVECEYLFIISYTINGYSFNRYMVECEFYPRGLSVHLSWF